tara:strand:+ start:73 stop:570 length:498 start_codon:yes stop_codon:yes gene_type:complete
MPEYEQSDEIIDFDTIPEQQEVASDKPQIDPGAHNLHILDAKYYRNDNNNLIAAFWLKSKTQADAAPANAYITLMKGNEPQITNMALCKQVMSATGVQFPDKQINAANIKSIVGEMFWAETEWNGDFFNISNPKMIDNEFKTPEPAAEPETKADADENFEDDIPF